MIIKVMTRKEPSFRQLLAYVTKDAADRRYVLTHNLIDSNLDAIAARGGRSRRGRCRPSRGGVVRAGTRPAAGDRSGAVALACRSSC